MVNYAVLDTEHFYHLSCLSHFSDELPENIRLKVYRYKRWQDRYASAFGKWLLREMLMDHGYEKECLRFIKANPYGKLFLDRQIHFNISHSGTKVLCAVSFQSEIGVDIEHCNPLDIKTFKPYLRSKEYLQILNSKNPLKSFYKLWTEKESVIKADGRGLSLNLKKVHIHQSKGIISEGNYTEWDIFPLDVGGDYLGRISVNKPALNLRNQSVKYLNKAIGKLQKT